MKKVCSSMKTRITNTTGSVSFLCPQCLTQEIVRSEHSRAIVAKYVCPGCGFEGPN